MNPIPRFRHARTLLVACLASGCQGPLDGPGEPPRAPTIEVRAESDANLESLPRVFRLQVVLDAQLAGSFDPDMLMLFSDELSSYYRGRLASAELPQTLLEREVPISSWETPAGFAVQPAQVLAPGRYALGLMGWGGLVDLTVVDDGSPLLTRVWPPADEGGGAGALYCADAALALEPTRLQLAPDGLYADWRPNLLSPERCFELTLSGPPAARVPPVRVGAALVDPIPLGAAEGGGEVPSAVACSEEQWSIAGGCLSVFDDRISITPPEEPQLWWLSLNAAQQAVETRAGLPFVVAGLQPDTQQRLTGDVFDLAGVGAPISLEFRTLVAREHVAVNEVYADANGPEPEQEWVELVNSGTLSVDLQGWILEDVGGQTELPSALLEPGGFAVVVNEAYTPDADYDLTIAPVALTLRVPALGKSGLSNSGELIRLRTPEGEIVSRFPALPAERGKSMARRSPWSPDDDLAEFGVHAEPGASPGSANSLAEE